MKTKLIKELDDCIELKVDEVIYQQKFLNEDHDISDKRSEIKGIIINLLNKSKINDLHDWLIHGNHGELKSSLIGREIAFTKYPEYKKNYLISRGGL